ncbi:hypothetical protein LQ938_09515 [Microbacterium sp. cx-55]|uniref:hypothetical protein n=1 Tax=Microbacterium sp. cx-55 TaxID=2875948 RepID=UPI001CBC8FE3|nr:hypothetical protein [Microbacterium sp. cx-55]MBZ4486001.1 hypothetical protein [Microbacterium sp. cx-55]UGB34126.1 hypothetical protein LQ938_09515 [Microbacterium sp. cx-55]
MKTEQNSTDKYWRTVMALIQAGDHDGADKVIDHLENDLGIFLTTKPNKNFPLSVGQTGS